MNEPLVPLAPLAGEWEGDAGVDFSFHHDVGADVETPYREVITFKPFGPVDNGTQHLYGLDYRTAMWRGDEADPFHTEVGYWLWCGGLRQVMRGFVIPRGSVILAGGEAGPDATTFTLKATSGDPVYGMATNAYLAENALCVEYEVSLQIDGETFSYEEDSVLKMAGRDELLHHTDRNTLHRTAAYELAA
jgi:hypothetical protein